MADKHHYKGLTDAQVLESRQKYGENSLSSVEGEPLWKQFLEKFTDPIIIILLVALVFSFGVSTYEYVVHNEGFDAFLEPIGILFAVLLATGVAFYFEHKANKQFEILNQVNDEIYYKVIRNEHITQVLKKDIVVGDIVILETGEEVPADGELLEAVSMHINESTLTGEPLVHKTTNPADFEVEATYPSNYVCRGTSVSDGHGIFEVKKVGDATEYGKVFEGVQIDNTVKTPLNEQLDKLAGMITKISYVIAILVIVGRLILYFTLPAHNINQIDWIDFGHYLLNTAMIAITVVVVAVPEGLPMSVTLSLAYSMRSMMATNNLVRKMHACETMGATTVICTDKTGTLTQNQMTIYETYFNRFTDEQLGEKLIAESMAVNSTAYLDFTDKEKPNVLGNPTEGALLLWLYGKGTNYLPIREGSEVFNQLTFSTERKYMATLVQSPALGKPVLYVKGAPEIVMTFCYEGGKFLSDIPQADFEAKLLQYQNQAMRTIGFAYKVIDDPNTVISENGKLVINGLNFIGITAISDPVRSDVPASIEECLHAGIQVKIVTGDTPGTAREIARQIHLWDDTCTERNQITGVEFAAMSDTELLDRITDLRVISRARPLDKARLVNLLQQKGEVVAVTGDGTNDAPALKAAQVGLSMGDGTSVAKEASDITILDNSFSSIGKAVMWGRSLYLNIQRFILFQMTINVAACIIVLIGAFLGVESPLTVTQMLWVNLIMDTFAALALASLPPSNRVMNDKPRARGANIISSPMAKGIFGVGGFFVLLLFGFIQYFKNEKIESLTEFSITDYFSHFFHFGAPEGNLSAYELSLFFSIFVFLQFWNMFNAKAYRTGKSTFYNIGKSQGFILIATVIVIGQVFITTFGGQMFNVTPLKLTDWTIIIGATSLVLWTGEILRAIKTEK
ncbi:calcium-translocating P-type ATPase, PMCA-type [Capnocytophaga ochracea]|uniref:calcium-translocating P-type ATPase, PMCA-type n=1 Tax=Capnocytophaga ochracea TaxID=1018 RepID=UPI002B49910D|nr:calcium-translocating P-type ATPase, PMCA-type [Capnocytophaga ochracea]MEB3015822.1 calcium-translocating P-type ATPase, PMCA-type [Capnocytophaga ochracea]MEB3035703.1 calcium-translocating P-type ATPase, PMCA-type [Capnocytophaga ochracea]